MNRRSEIMDELRMVLLGRGHILDTVAPPLAFLISNLFLDEKSSLWVALALAVGFTINRFLKRQAWLYALGGLGGVPLAFLISYWLDSPEGFFLPGMISGGLSVVVCLVSGLYGRPAVALTSHIVRRWPLKWYWHPQVRPAYTEVSYIWAAFFAGRLGLEILLVYYRANWLHYAFNMLSGWPATIVLLIVSYLYGLWRLQGLKGPSVDEYTQGVEPPWTGQQRGF